MRLTLRIVAVTAVLTGLAALPLAGGPATADSSVPGALSGEGVNVGGPPAAGDRRSGAGAFLPADPRGAAGSGTCEAGVGDYRPPAPGAVTRLFDPPVLRWLAGHRGVDLSASPGDEVTSPGRGTVTFAGEVAGRGVVTVTHPDGLRSSLEPLDAAVHAGDTVVAGAVLGTLQSRSGHDGVHWGVRDGDRYLDPLGLLACAEPVVLLP